MNNVEGIVLKCLLSEESRDKALEGFSLIHEKYFSPTFGSIYRNIKKFYEDKGYIPTVSDLKVYKSRDARTLTALSSLELVKDIDVDIDLAVEALADQFAQNTTLDLLISLVEDIPIMDRSELQDRLASIPLELDDQLDSSEKIFTMKELTVFPNKSDTEYSQVYSGICNKWDSSVGYRRQELALFGGKRGSGKSIICANMVNHQMITGKVGVYFSIEMTANETFERLCSIRSQVPFSKIRNNELTEEETRKLAKTVSDMYEGGDKVYEEHFIVGLAPNLQDFENQLKSTCELKDDGRLIIIDDRELSLSTIDVQLNKLKSKYGDSLELVVIDYVNQVVVPGHSGVEMYDWKIQTVVAKQLKNLARKYDILIVSPYQIDDSGVARFSKGILDACDTAQLIMAHDKDKEAITFSTAKVRSGNDELDCTVGMDWNTLTINPAEVVIPEDMATNEDDETSPFLPPQGAMEL